MSSNLMLEGKVAFPSEYIGAVDLQGKATTVVIEAVKWSKVMVEGGKEADKIVLTFVGAKKKLILNKTNAKAIAAKHGGIMDEWPGKQVVLYPTQCRAFGQTTDCIRVK